MKSAKTTLQKPKASRKAFAQQEMVELTYLADGQGWSLDI